jgi:arginine utilization regulatory protein
MELIDIVIILDEHSIIISIDWKNEQLKKVYKNTWDTYINRHIESISDIRINKDIRNLYWKDESFIFEELKLPNNHDYLLLKRKDYKEYLYEQSLNKINEGIQIYDKNSCMVFINEASKKISSFSDDKKIIGKHLLDLYDLNEKYSTTLTSLRSKAPVINRFDAFKLKSGVEITSVNTAYPIFYDNNLIGVVTFDQDVNVINKEIEKNENIKKAMLEQGISFTDKVPDTYHFSDIIGKNKKLLDVVDLSKKNFNSGLQRINIW